MLWGITAIYAVAVAPLWRSQSFAAALSVPGRIIIFASGVGSLRKTETVVFQ